MVSRISRNSGETVHGIRDRIFDVGVAGRIVNGCLSTSSSAVFRVVGRRSRRSRPVVLCRRGAEGGAQAGEVDRAPGLFGHGVDD